MPNNNFSKELMSWYKRNARDLPWRHTNDPYKIWISEIMLQQTTVNAVIPYFQRWIKKYPTVGDVALTPLQEILKDWQGLGYYQRAKNIHKAAQMIVMEFDGKIPNDPEMVKRLPGFGPYTIGAVLSIAFDRKLPIIDANVRRIMMRLMATEGVADTKQDEQILQFLKKVQPNKGNNIFNQALMELGALVCRNREPICLLCPVRNHCQAFKEGKQEIIPTPKKKIIQNVDASIAVIRQKNNYLIQKRSSKGLLADLWEFPGGKIEKGETPRNALYREIKEELGVNIRDAQPLMEVFHHYTQFKVKLHVWMCTIDGQLKEDEGRKWVNTAALKKFPMPSGSARIVEKLLTIK